MKKLSVVLKVISALLLIAAGIVSLVGASSFYCHPDYTSYVYYGGDAYTGIQQASADASNNIRDVGVFIDDACTVFATVFGLAFIAGGIGMLASAVQLAEMKGRTVCETSVEEESAQEVDSTL